ncbi:unnamed protein product [Discosporangium mesarthrocarpum]
MLLWAGWAVGGSCWRGLCHMGCGDKNVVFSPEKELGPGVRVCFYQKSYGVLGSSTRSQGVGISVRLSLQRGDPTDPFCVGRCWNGTDAPCSVLLGLPPPT